MSTTPAFALTYDTLTTTVEQYLERSDAAVVNQIPTFIMLAEFEIAQEIKTLGQLQVAQFSLGPQTIGGGTPNIVAKPARWRKTVSMNVTNPYFPTSSGGTVSSTTPVLLRKYEYIQQYLNQNSTLTGTPQFFADYSWDYWFVAPIPPTVAYPMEVLYYERIDPLSSVSQTNWLTINAPNALLYGTLLQAVMFLKDDQRVIFQQKYTEAIQALKTEDQTRVADRQAIAIDS
jgi:hypothetical protein